jgi:hypothetical protein
MVSRVSDGRSSQRCLNRLVIGCRGGVDSQSAQAIFRILPPIVQSNAIDVFGRIRRAYSRALITACVGVVGCGSPVEPRARLLVPDVREYVTGAALTNLDSNGHFVINYPSPDPERLTATGAALLALAYIRRIAAGNTIPLPGAEPTKDYVERGHGRPVSWAKAELGPRAPFLALSALSDLPDSLPAFVHNFYGPHYLVPIYTLGRQFSTVAVAASSRGEIDENGFAKGLVGNEFTPVGIPHDAKLGHPASPEAIVQHAATALGARVTEVPYLLQPGYTVSVTQSTWVLILERSVQVRRILDGAVIEVSKLYVGQFSSFTDPRTGSLFNLRFFVPAENQPTTERIRYPTGSETREIFWPIRDGAPVDLREVEVMSRSSDVLVY